MIEITLETFNGMRDRIRELTTELTALREALNQIVVEGKELSSGEYFTVNDGSAVVYLDRLEDVIDIAAAALSEEGEK